MANDYLQNVLGQDYQEQDITQSPYVKITNGKFQFIIIDIDKPDKVFFDLTKVFNASTGEGQKILPIQFVRGGKVITDMTGYSISMDGTYPDNTTPFHVQGELMNSTTGAFINFSLPLGLFQAVGVYSFQFTITNTSTGDKETSHYMFFNVTNSSVSLAESWNTDITPFDNQYQKWLSGVENQINNLNSQLSNAQTNINNLGKQITNFQGLLDNYTGNVNGIVNTAVNGRFNQANTWNATQTFNSGIDVSGDFTFKGQPVDWPDTFQSANIVGNSVEGTKVHYMATAQFLFVFGWIGQPKSTQDTFKAYIPTSLTNRIVIPGDSNGSVYYVGVDDGDWVHPSGNTTPVELCLGVQSGTLGINSAAGDGGCRINWVIPIYA